jgi:hypothetical protein
MFQERGAEATGQHEEWPLVGSRIPHWLVLQLERVPRVRSR